VITRTVKIQLAVFLTAAFLGIAYVLANYVQVPFIAKTFTVKAQLTDSGGIFQQAQVTYRGVVVGKVGTLHLIPNGVEADLKISDTWRDKIPADARTVIQNMSAVGEQYVDLQPQSNSGPYLAANSVIPMSRSSLPIQTVTLLSGLDQLVNSINKDDLNTTLNELGKALQGTGPDLSRIIDQGDAVLTAAQQNLPQTLKLIDDGKTVLNTQRDVSGQLKSFAASLNSFTNQLASPTTDNAVRTLLDTGLPAAQQLQSLLADNAVNLPTVLANLTTLGSITSARIPQLTAMMELYPANVANGFLVAGCQGPAPAGSTAPCTYKPGQEGRAGFGLVLSGTGPCTQGYLSDTQRRDNNTNPATNPSNFGGLATLGANCTSPVNGPPPPNGDGANVDVRRASRAPRPAGDTTATQGGAVGTVASGQGTQSVGAATPTTWDPTSGLLFGTDGTTYRMTSNQTQAARGTSWQWLLLNPGLS
jgi:phospholipid/cholesterol/gamma-HCH transport system substrate-binding protein